MVCVYEFSINRSIYVVSQLYDRKSGVSKFTGGPNNRWLNTQHLFELECGALLTFAIFYLYLHYHNE